MNLDIEYFKQQLNQKLSKIKVDAWVRYITVDKDGAVWSFSVKPFVLELDGICDCWNIVCRGCDKCKYLFNLDSECILCWKDLLFEWNENIESQ